MRFVLLLLFLWVPLSAVAQDEVIIRLADGVAPELVAALEGLSAPKSGAIGTLFEGVAESKSVLQWTAGADKRINLPIRAYTLVLNADSEVDAVLERWEGIAGVAYVQRNHRYQLDAFTPQFDDPQLDSLDHLPVIRALEAWERTTGDPGVRIGFVDTGLYFEHPDFEGQVWVNPGEDLNGDGRATPSDFNGVDDDGNGFVDDLTGYDFLDRSASVEPGEYFERDPDPSEDRRIQGGQGHGTIVAGALAARLSNNVGIAGVAPGCSLVPLRAFGADGRGDDDDIAAAIVYAAHLGIEVLNLSFGDVYYSPIMEEAIRFAVTQGTVVVASGGNAGGDDAHYPSDYPEVISVVWLNADGERKNQFAEHGIGVDLGAPGSFIYTTTLPLSDDGEEPTTAQLYGRRSGSSMAAPLVAGAAALLKVVDASLSPASIRGILTTTAIDIEEPGWDHRTGAGRLDVASALLRALPSRVEITAPEHNGGIAAETFAITGTVLHPSFDFFTLEYAVGTDDVDGRWQTIVGPVERQYLEDTLAVWNTAVLVDGAYTLRLSAQLRTGGTLEDRRRVFLDRTPPEIEVRILDAGLIGPHYGLIADLKTDDLADVAMEIEIDGRLEVVQSDRRARRHELQWADERGRGGLASVTVIAKNQTDSETNLKQDIRIPLNRANSALFEEERLGTQAGYLMPVATDYDRDGLLEITMNVFDEGSATDTLAIFEWDGAGFKPVSALLATVFPRDAGDSDGDGLSELLTQAAGITLLLEQPDAKSYPTALAYIDTTGLGSIADSLAASAALLTDLDRDGQGEILVHNVRQWRLLEADDGTYSEVARLNNPTSVRNSEILANEFSNAEALVGDFDADGNTDVLVGDGDGDWIMYEAIANNQFKVAWTHETDRYDAGARLAAGDFDGDGVEEFATYTRTWPNPNSENEREPEIGLYYFWDGADDDSYVLLDSLPVQGNFSRHGSMISDDYDGDGRDELVIVHAPDMYVLGFEQNSASVWELRFHRGIEMPNTASGLRSIALTSDDFDADGRPELIAAGADGFLHRFEVESPGVLAPPRISKAHALDAKRVLLDWTAPDADSVAVYRGAPFEALDLLLTTSMSSTIDSTAHVARYALRSWKDGILSSLSETRLVRPHAPAVVTGITFPAEGTVELVFSEPLQDELRPEQFQMPGFVTLSMLPGRGGTSVTLRFKPVPTGSHELMWGESLRDKENTPTATSSIELTFPQLTQATLFIERFEIPEAGTIRLIFSEPLDGDQAQRVSNFKLEPSGEVVSARWDATLPNEVLIVTRGRAVGATGLETVLMIDNLRSKSGSRLAVESRTVNLALAAASIADAYVFPNPYHGGTHEPKIIVAGLSAESTVRIFSAQGGLVRLLEERDGDGGVAWDLLDRDGAMVPSGVYLLRVEAAGQDPVLLKAAIVR